MKSSLTQFITSLARFEVPPLTKLCIILIILFFLLPLAAGPYSENVSTLFGISLTHIDSPVSLFRLFVHPFTLPPDTIYLTILLLPCIILCLKQTELLIQNTLLFIVGIFSCSLLSAYVASLFSSQLYHGLYSFTLYLSFFCFLTVPGIVVIRKRVYRRSTLYILLSIGTLGLSLIDRTFFIANLSGVVVAYLILSLMYLTRKRSTTAFRHKMNSMSTPSDKAQAPDIQEIEESVVEDLLKKVSDVGFDALQDEDKEYLRRASEAYQKKKSTS